MAERGEVQRAAQRNPLPEVAAPVLEFLGTEVDMTIGQEVEVLTERSLLTERTLTERSTQRVS